jgi:iron-sulfur cluster repair protein YtfE (RIC family)
MTETHAHPKVPRATSAASSAPTAPSHLTGDETVDEVVEHHPGLRTSLMAYGLCTCCSGGLTLRQSAEGHGVPLSAILEDLEHELAKGA